LDSFTLVFLIRVRFTCRSNWHAADLEVKPETYAINLQGPRCLVYWQPVLLLWRRSLWSTSSPVEPV